MFDLTTTEEQGQGSNKQLYIYPGVIDCKIKGWAHSVNQNGKPVLEFSINSLDSEEEGQENIKVFKDFYMSEAGAKVHMPRIKHIVTKVTKADAIKKVETLDELVAMLNHLTKDKNIRLLFNGREYEYNGEVKTTAVLPLNNFAEAIQQGAEYPPVTKEDSKLVYDENNPKQLEKLNIQPDSEEKTTEDKPAWMED